MLEQMNRAVWDELMRRAKEGRAPRVLRGSEVPESLRGVIEDARLFDVLALELPSVSTVLPTAYVEAALELVEAHKDFFARVDSAVLCRDSGNVTAYVFQNFLLAITFAADRLELGPPRQPPKGDVWEFIHKTFGEDVGGSKGS